MLNNTKFRRDANLMALDSLYTMRGAYEFIETLRLRCA